MENEPVCDERSIGITMVGDSNTVVYQNELFEACGEAHDGRTTFAMRVFYLDELRIEDLVDRDGQFNERVREALASGLVVSRGAPLRALGAAAGRPLIVNVGHRDFARVLLQLGPGVDFVLPHGLHSPAPLEPIGSSYDVPVALVRELVAPALRALEAAFRLLASAGFRHLYFVGFRPPTLDDEAFEQKWGLRSQAALRYKLSLLMNDSFADVCARTGVTYVDQWPLLCSGDLFDEAFEFDYIHITAAAARIVAKSILETYLAKPGVA